MNDSSSDVVVIDGRQNKIESEENIVYFGDCKKRMSRSTTKTSRKDRLKSKSNEMKFSV